MLSIEHSAEDMPFRIFFALGGLNSACWTNKCFSNTMFRLSALSLIGSRIGLGVLWHVNLSDSEDLRAFYASMPFTAF